MTLSLRLTRAAARVTGLPADAERATRLCLADALAVMLAATRMEPACAPFAEHARSAPGPCTLLAGGTAQPGAAALANGALAHALDFEDTFDAAGLHPHAAVVPAVLALAELQRSSLSAALRAIAVGADAACRIGLSLARDPAARGWYHPPMIGAAGAALAAAHLLRLTPAQGVAALSLTLMQFALTDALKRAPQSPLRAVRDGFAARAAVEGALLARAGSSGTPDPLCEAGGLFDLLTGAPPAGDALDRPGDPFLGEEVSIKQWPCCRGTHGAVRLALDLRAQGQGTADLAAVAFRVRPPDDMLFTPLADRQAPSTAIGARFSIPYCFAHALLTGPPALHSFDAPTRSDPAVLALAARVSMAAVGPDLVPAADIRLADGTVRRHALPPPPSARATGIGFADLDAKLSGCLDAAGAGPAARAALRAIEALPGETDLHDVLRRMTTAD